MASLPTKIPTDSDDGPITCAAADLSPSQTSSPSLTLGPNYTVTAIQLFQSPCDERVSACGDASDADARECEHEREGKGELACRLDRAFEPTVRGGNASQPAPAVTVRHHLDASQ